MDAEFSVELGADDPTLAVPWSSPDGAVRYVDLSQHPEEIAHLPEVLQFPELGPVLRDLNGENSACRTAKCDTWFDTQMDIDDEPYGAAVKCASYIDVFFCGERKTAGFGDHEKAARDVVQRLRAKPEAAARSAVTVRRCFFLETPDAEEGLYWTVYVFGYGKTLEAARENWGQALATVAATLLSGCPSSLGR